MVRNSLLKFVAVAPVIAFIVLTTVCHPALAERENCRIAVVKGKGILQFNIALEGFS